MGHVSVSTQPKLAWRSQGMPIHAAHLMLSPQPATLQPLCPAFRRRLAWTDHTSRCPCWRQLLTGVGQWKHLQEMSRGRGEVGYLSFLCPFSGHVFWQWFISPSLLPTTAPVRWPLSHSSSLNGFQKHHLGPGPSGLCLLFLVSACLKGLAGSLSTPLR